MRPTRRFFGPAWLLSPDQPHTQTLQHARCKLRSFMLIKSDCEYGHFLQNLSLQLRYYVSVMADDESLGQSVVAVLVQTMPAKSNVHSLNNIELRHIRPERAVDSQCLSRVSCNCTSFSNGNDQRTMMYYHCHHL